MGKGYVSTSSLGCGLDIHRKQYILFTLRNEAQLFNRQLNLTQICKGVKQRTDIVSVMCGLFYEFGYKSCRKCIYKMCRNLKYLMIELPELCYPMVFFSDFEGQKSLLIVRRWRLLSDISDENQDHAGRCCKINLDFYIGLLGVPF